MKPTKEILSQLGVSESAFDKVFEYIAGTCSDTGKRPADGSSHNCVACRAFRTDRVAQDFEKASAQATLQRSQAEKFIAQVVTLSDEKESLVEALEDRESAFREASDAKVELSGLLKDSEAKIANLGANLDAEKHLSALVISENDSLKALVKQLESFRNRVIEFHKGL